MNPLWSNIFRRKAEEESVAYFLGTTPVFAEMSTRELGYFENLIHLRQYSAGEIVFEEGDPGAGMYLIRTGRVRIFHRNEDGRESELATLMPGDFFGETTLAAPSVRSASARVLDATELVGLFRADLLLTSEKHPGTANRLLLNLNRLLSERLQAAGRRMRQCRCPDDEEKPGEQS